MVSIDVAVTQPAQLGECPVWVPDEERLYWIDIDGCAIHRLDPSSGSHEHRTIAGRPGSMAPTTAPGTWLLATEHQLGWFDWASGGFTPWLDLEQAGVGIRMNDGRTDPAGRFLVGSMYEDTGAGKRVGSLHQIDADGTHRVLRTGVGTSNGLGFDPERSLMYFADTPTLEVAAFDYELETGVPSNERRLFDYETVPGKPDGACVDADGCYWSASVRGSAVIRVTPDGRLDRRIELPVALPTMPAFGGTALETLFVTSIADGEPGPSGVAQGALLAIDLSSEGITGRIDPPFTGTPPRAENQ